MAHVLKGEDRKVFIQDYFSRAESWGPTPNAAEAARGVTANSRGGVSGRKTTKRRRPGWGVLADQPSRPLAESRPGWSDVKVGHEELHQLPRELSLQGPGDSL